MSEETPDGEEPFVVRLGDGPGLVFVRMELPATRKAIVVQGALRPDLVQTTVAGSRARALNVSQGQGVMLQLVRGTDGDGDPWGPIERVTPAIDEELDVDSDDASSGILIGRDFAQHLWITYLEDKLVMITRPPGEG